ncbi:MAG: sensor histidine kinase, partial [Clostridiales bacterium]
MEWGYYVIYIKDKGVGIPQNDRETVFEPFYQGDLSRTKQHSGLGLYVTRQIIEKHNGTIKLFQEEDYKVVFKIFFKISEQN